MAYTATGTLDFCPVEYIPDGVLQFGECGYDPGTVTYKLSATLVPQQEFFSEIASSFAVNTQVVVAAFFSPLTLTATIAARTSASPPVFFAATALLVPTAAFTAAIKPYFSSNIWRGVVASLRSRHQTFSAPAKGRTQWAPGVSTETRRQITGAPAQPSTCAGTWHYTNQPLNTFYKIQASHGSGLGIFRLTESRQIQPLPTIAKVRAPYVFSRPVKLQASSWWLPLASVADRAVYQYTPSTLSTLNLNCCYTQTTGAAYAKTLVHSPGHVPTAGATVPIPPRYQRPFIAPYTPTATLAFVCPLPSFPSLKFREPACIRMTAATLEHYSIMNSFALKTLEDTPIHCESFSISLDCDSWSWSWSAKVDPAHLALFAANLFEPLELLVTVNGINIFLLAEQISRDRSGIANSSLSVTGRGRNAWLSAPYVAAKTTRNTVVMTAKQIAEYVLTENSVPIGWDLDWEVEDWLIPAGAWVQTGSYIDGISRIAEACGAYIQPHDTDQTLRIFPYYPVPPWEWGTVVPNFALPEEVMVVEGIQWQIKPDYDSVYIVGGGYGGRIDRIVRAGSGAQLPAKTIQDDLATDPIMTRQRGVRVLGDAGKIALVKLKLPILPATGIIRPGMFISYVAGEFTRLGLVRSVAVDYAFPEAWQTIELETHLT